MSPTQPEELSSWIAPKITKKVTRFREPIGAEKRFCVTLRYLATGDIQVTMTTGDAQVTIAPSYRISPSSVGRIIKETTAAIWDVLFEKEFVSYPNSIDEWIKVAGFEKQWNFPKNLSRLNIGYIT